MRFILLSIVMSLAPLGAAHADEAKWDRAALEADWERATRRDTAARSGKFKAERVHLEGGAVYAQIERQAQKAVNRLTPAKAAEFNVKLDFQVQLWGLDKGDGAIGRFLRGIKPVRLGDHGNNVEKFMEAVKARGREAGAHPDVYTFAVPSASIVRPVIKSRARALKTRLKASFRQRRMKKAAARRAPTKAAPKQAKKKARARSGRGR